MSLDFITACAKKYRVTIAGKYAHTNVATIMAIVLVNLELIVWRVVEFFAYLLTFVNKAKLRVMAITSSAMAKIAKTM